MEDIRNYMKTENKTFVRNESIHERTRKSFFKRATKSSKRFKELITFS